MAVQSPIVIGNVSGQFTPAPGAVLDVVAWGLDTMQRPYRCLTADFERLVPAKGTPDTQYPRMYLQKYYETRIEGLLSDSLLTYIGLKNGGFPDALITVSRQDRTASVERNSTIVTPDGSFTKTKQYEVLYQSPTISARYLTDGLARTFTATIDQPIIILSNWQLITKPSSTSEPVRGSSFPPSPNWTLYNDGGTKSPIEGTPFFEINITYYWQLS